MTPFRRPAVRLVLAAAAAGLLVPAVPALGGGPAGTTAGGVLVAPIACNAATCEGTEAADTIVANNNPNKVIGKGGDDDIELDAAFPSGSPDVGLGGEGRDCIDGGAGDDIMIGGPGDDNRPCEFTAFVDPQAALTGGPGNDRIYGGPGNDSMNGIFDDDVLNGGPGDDFLRDGSPDDEDRRFGRWGKDTQYARDGVGADLIDGGPGKDDCSGDAVDTFVNCEKITRL
jgi:Ca2+-binding RTX toxin-like protein